MTKAVINPPVDAIFDTIGDFGKWQLRISILMALLKLPIAWFQLGNILIAPKTDFNCRKPDFIQNVTDVDWRSFYTRNVTSNLDSCFFPSESELLLLNGSSALSSLTSTKCDFGYDYNRILFNSTIVTEWDLVCDRSWMANFSQMILMIGVLFGNILFGITADRFGRKSSLICAIAGQSFFGILMAFAPGYWTFTFARFLLGVSNGGTMIISFVLCMEVVSSKHRPVIPILYQIPFGLGSSLMALLGYWLRDWRELQLTLSLISLVFLLNYWFCTESPRWLLATNRRKDGCALLAKICLINGVPVENIKLAGCHLLQDQNMNMPKFDQNDTKTVNFTVIFKIPVLLKRTLIIYVNWFINGATFFAFSLHLGSVGTNPWLTVGTSGLAVVPGALICMVCIQKYGRKLSLIYANLVISICLIMLQGIPLQWTWLKLPLISIAVVGLSVSMPALYLYTGELYPTVIRNVGVGSAAMFSRVGSLLSPLILACGTSEVGGFITVSWSNGPPVLLVLAVFMVVQAFIVLPLPETKDKPLSDTIEQCLENGNEWNIRGQDVSGIQVY